MTGSAWCPGRRRCCGAPATSSPLPPAPAIRTCARSGLLADREPGKTGTWCGPTELRKKLCSIGIACRKWITFHGLALNVTTDLAYFRRINPCGFEASVMSSLAEQLGDVDIATVRRALIEELGVTLGRATA